MLRTRGRQLLPIYNQLKDCSPPETLRRAVLDELTCASGRRLSLDRA